MSRRYRRMLKGMLRKERRQRPKARQPWFVYILRCSDGKFYTGITNDLLRRLKAHNDGKGASFTRSRRPVEMIYQERTTGRAPALVREYAVKGLTRKQKERLISGEPTGRRRRRKGTPK